MTSLKRLYGYLWRYRWSVIGSLAFSVLASVFGIFSLATLVPFFNKLFGNVQDTSQLSRMEQFILNLLEPLSRYSPKRAILLLVGLLLVVRSLYVLCRFLQGYLSRRVVTYVPRDLSNDMYSTMVGLSLDFFGRTGVGEAGARFMSDMDNVQRGLNTLFSKVLLVGAQLVLSVAFLFAVSWKLTLLNFLVMPMIAVVLAVFGKRVKRATRKALVGKGELLRHIQETFTGIRIVQAFTAEDRERKTVRETNRRITKQMIKIAVSDIGTTCASEWLMVLAICIMVVAGGYMVLAGSLSAGMFLVYYGLIGQVGSQVKSLGNVNNRLQGLIAGADRIFEYIDAAATVRNKPDAVAAPPIERSIVFRDVTFSYSGSSESDDLVLKGIDLEAGKGQVVALVGKTGSGKSTLVNLVPRFFDVTGGAVLIDGTDVRDVTLESLRGQIGLVSQDSILFHDTFAGNIAYGSPDTTREQVEDAARRAYADEFIDEYPEGYDTMVEEGGRNLSGGQKQRLCLARAICKNPSILILDEATSALDSHSEHLIQRALEQFMVGRTTFVIAHRLSTVENADTIVVLQDGQIAGMGRHAELIESCDLYRNLYSRQFSTE